MCLSRSFCLVSVGLGQGRLGLAGAGSRAGSGWLGLAGAGRARAWICWARRAAGKFD
ncbi:hypothetical protein BY996DRAFT_6610689 [Phakopsora pachyrhizi]|nr:hypothetical protein BY996DRAFT_6561408 [Phakopsora pachyrhizi]KAI8451078.1 hypothetical protein BY996DRAFT_6610689 [Phakopsora pachyrhizi]